MSKIIAIALAMWLGLDTGAFADEFKAGSEGRAPFFCHASEDITNAGVVLEGAPDAVVSAGQSLILAGKCAYFPAAMPFEAVELVDTGDALKEHDVWKVKLPDGSFWFVLHKATMA